MSATAYHVLVVDDDIATSVLTRLRLEHAGFTASCALNAEDGIAMLETRGIHAVVVDYQLAQQNGIDFFRLAVMLGIDVPAVMVTGIDDPDLEEYALEAGMRAFLTKHLSYLDSLPAIIQDVIAGRTNHSRCQPSRVQWSCSVGAPD